MRDTLVFRGASLLKLGQEKSIYKAKRQQNSVTCRVSDPAEVDP